MATRGDLVNYRNMLKTVHGRVARAMAAGQSAEDLVKSGAFKDIEKILGRRFPEHAEIHHRRLCGAEIPE